ncbi:SigE family RNA polymerase sigma factor, partial [Streptomyces sp. NPDC056730]
MQYAIPAPPPWWSRLLARMSPTEDMPTRGRHPRALGTPHHDEPRPTLAELYRARRLDMVRL